MKNENEQEVLELDAQQVNQAVGGQGEPVTSAGVPCPRCHKPTMTMEMQIYHGSRLIIRSCPCGYREIVH